MAGRLWPLLALLGAAVAVDLCARMNPCANGGTCSMVGSAWVCRCPGRWRGKRCQAGPEPAELPKPSPRGPLSTLPPGQATPSPGSWDPGPTARAPPWHPSPAASGAAEMATTPTAAERTSGAGNREWAEPVTRLGRKGPSPPATAAAAWLSRPTSPAGATVLGYSPSFSAEGATTSPSQGSGTVAGPRSKAPRVAGKTTLPPSLHPASSPRRQREEARPTPTEPPGPSLAAGAALPGPASSADSALAQLAQSGHPAPQTAGPGAFPRQPASSNEGYEESGRKRSLHTTSAGPRKPWSAVGLLLPSTVSPAPPGRSTDPEEGTLGGLAESVAPTASHKAPLEQRTPGKEREGPTLTPSPGVSRASAPHVTPSSSYAAATSAGSPDFLPHRTGHAPNASQPAPSSSSPLSHGGLSAGPTREAGTLGTGQGARWNPAALQTSTDPLTGPGTEPLHPRGAPQAPATHQFLEPFSPLPSPALRQHPPTWVTEGGTSSTPASSSSRTSAAGTDRAGLSPDSPKTTPTDTALGSFPHQAASSQASLPGGETTAAAAPTVRFALTAIWRPPRPTESQPSSLSAAFATREDSAPTGAPRLPPWTALFSRSTISAVTTPISQVHETEAPGQFSATRHSWSPPARTWSWSRADRSTESPGRAAPPSPPLPTAGTPRHTWPPARADLPVASTWLLAAMPEAATPLLPATPREGRPRAQHILVAENQPPALKASSLHLPWELVLGMEFSRGLGSPHSPESQGLMFSINVTVAPLFAPLPGFQRLEVTSIRPSLRRPGGVVVLLDAVFQAQAPGWRAALSRPGLLGQPLPRLWAVNTSVVIQSLALERPLDLCAELFRCPAGYDCVVGEDRNATCASVCHRQYCRNQGICTHAANQTPVCQCPVGSDFWFLGLRCDYRVTQQGLLGVAGGLLLSLLLIGAAIFVLVVRRVRLLLLEARADQTKSSYRRFCRLDDVSAHYWSEPWLASVDSLDNPAFSNSEELLHLQALEPPRCSCREGCLATDGHRKPSQGPPCRGGAGRPRSLCSWERSSGSGNEHMVDSGKASEVSVCSWPVEPIQWRPSPARQEHAHQPTHKGQRPHSYCEGMELVSLERSWTA